MTAPRDPSWLAPDATATQGAPVRHRQTVRSHRVFISSTSVDLSQHRLQLRKALLSASQVPVCMEDFGAGAADATTVSYTELASTDIVVLIVAWRYGFVPEDERRSVTELEYEEAKRLGLPIYVYLADPATEADDRPEALFPASTRQPDYAHQLTAFRTRLSDSNENTYDTFDAPADLSSKVLAALWRRQSRHEQVGRHPLTEAQALDRTTFKLGDDDAATFEYLKTPLQDAWNTATQSLANASAGIGGKRGIIVLGEANAGKTRLAVEAVIQTLPDWPVLRWSEAFTSSDLPPAGSLPGAGLVLFIDDLQNYAPMTQRGADGLSVVVISDRATTLRALVESITAPLVIVATCRSEDEGRTYAELGWLFTKLASVWLPQFSTDEQDEEAQRVVADFAVHSAAHIEDWDGTLGSLVLGLSTKRAQYENLTTPAVTVLHAMKLLTEAWVFSHTDRRLRAVCAEIFHQKAMAQDERVWEEAYKELLRLQFVRVLDSAESPTGNDATDMTLVIRKDTYFDKEKVIRKYPDSYDPGQLFRHLAALIAVFAELKDADGLFSAGNVFNERKEYKRALAAFKQALTLRPDDAETWLAKGVSLSKLGRWDETLEAFEQASALAPGDALAWYNRGVALSTLGHAEQALNSYEQAQALDPDYPPVWSAIGATLGTLGRAEEALEAFKRARALGLDGADTWHNIGIALVSLGRYQQALRAFNRALASDSDDADIWLQKGIALALLGHTEEALAAFEQALALDPQNALAWYNKGAVLGTLGHWQEALAVFDQALSLDPEPALFREGKAQALRALHRDAEAEALEEDRA